MGYKGIWIPMELIAEKMTWTKRILIAEITQLEMLDDGCLASNGHFAQKLSMTKQGVSKALNELERDGYITIDNAQSKRNHGRKITINEEFLGINCGKSGINCGKSGINHSLQSKENKSINKNIEEKNKKKSFKKWTREEFIEEIKNNDKNYSSEMKNDFFDYWSELNDKGVMKFQLNDTWGTAGRLATWYRRSIK